MELKIESFFEKYFIIDILVNMILILRGHIRDSFKNDNLYNLIVELAKLFDIDIYIHTWNILQNGLSWRPLEVIKNEVNKELIYDYFRDHKSLIKHIIIDNDENIKLNGLTDGVISHSKIPKKGWKNMWYGIHSILEYIYTNVSQTEKIIHTRFDVLQNSNSFNRDQIIDFINKNINNPILNDRNIFISDKLIFGIDNIYLGIVKNMYTVAKRFYYELDDIEKIYPETFHPEFLVMLESDRLLKSQIPIIENEQPYGMKAYYGTSNVKKDVTKIVMDVFMKGTILHISKDIKMNDYFGDPKYGKVKQLTIEYKNTKYVIDEYRTEDIHHEFVQ
jgi:hypothetical protein